MFEQTLQDLIKGLRNTKNDPVAYVAKAIQEIKDEIKSRDVGIKTQAIQKLTYVSSSKPVTWKKQPRHEPFAPSPAQHARARHELGFI